MTLTLFCKLWSFITRYGVNLGNGYSKPTGTTLRRCCLVKGNVKWLSYFPPIHFKRFLTTHQVLKENINIGWSAGNAGYTDSISAVGWDSPNESPSNDSKLSNGEALVLRFLEMCNTFSVSLLPSLLWPEW